MFLWESFSSEEIRGAYQTWDFIDGALQSEADRSILKRCKSPRKAFYHLEKLYDPESEVTTQKLYFTTPSNSNPIEALHALEDPNNQMAEKGMGIPDTFLHARFVCALPDEYGHIKATLQAMKNRDRTEIIRIIGRRYSTLPQKKRSQWLSQPPKQAFFWSGARRGCGRSRGGGSSKGGGSSSEGVRSSASNASDSSHGGGSRPHDCCWRCNRRGHIREECTTKESDFLAKCARCSGFGHEESTCSSDAVVLAMELPMSEEDLAVEAQALVAK